MMILLGAIPVITGVITMFGLADPLYASAHLPRSALLDSNLRFFGGIWLGLGLAAWWLILGAPLLIAWQHRIAVAR